MTEQALLIGVQKYLEPFKSFASGQLVEAEAFMRRIVEPYWAGLEGMSYADAVADIDFTKSPGWPYYFDCETKADALRKYGDVIQQNVDRLLAGDDTVVCPFSITLKDELRPKEKVMAHKTRVFQACNIDHLLASSMLFKRQNEALMATVGSHPVAVGIQVPGPGFVSLMRRIRFPGYSVDIAGCDTRFHLDIAGVIRNVRAHFLSAYKRASVFNLYDQVYCGFAVVLGIIYTVWHQKSGWLNTSHDTSFYVLLALFITVRALAPDKSFGEVIDEVFTYGDDNIWSVLDERVGVLNVAQYLQEYNILLEFGDGAPGTGFSLVFLSHHIRERYVDGLGSFYVAAGNLDKLLCSRNWYRAGKMETVLAQVVHLLGVRIALWPWKLYFDETDEILDDFVAKLRGRGELNPVIEDALRSARLTEREIAMIHLRLEGFNFSLLDLSKWVLKSAGLTPSPFKDEVLQSRAVAMKKTTSKSKNKNKNKGAKNQELYMQSITLQRAAQSAKDKAVAKALKQKAGNQRVDVPAGIGMRGAGSRFTTRKIKYKGSDAIRITGRDYLGTVDWTGVNDPAGTLFNTPISPGVFFGSRVYKLAQTFEKYRFNKFSVIATPSASTDYTGIYGMSYDHDPTDPTPPTGFAGVREFMAFPGTVKASAFTPCTGTWSPEEPVTDFFVDPSATGDPRLADQGQFYLWVVSNLANDAIETPAIQILLEIEYDLTLYVPQISEDTNGVQMFANGTSLTPIDMDQFQQGATDADLLNLLSASDFPQLTQTFLGESSKFALIEDDLGVGIYLPQGVWDVDFGLECLNTAGSNDQFLSNIVHSVVASNPALQNLVTIVTNRILGPAGPNSVGVATQRGSIAAFLTIAVPLGGAILRAVLSNSGSVDQYHNVTELFFNLFIGPSSWFNFDVLVGINHPGKFGEIARKRIRLKEAQKEAAIKAKIDGQLEALKFVPKVSPQIRAIKAHALG